MAQHQHQIQEFKIASGAGRLLIGATSAKDTVAISGSVLGGPNHLAHSLETVPGIAASLMDAGTTKRSKSEIRESLADRGISLSFWSSGDRTYFFANCFPENISFTLTLIAECLHSALFQASELDKAVVRARGRIAETKSRTGTRASIAFAQSIYDAKHVNYVSSLEAREKALGKITRNELKKFSRLLGRGGLVLAITGDVKVPAARKAAEAAFTSLPEGTMAPALKSANQNQNASREVLVRIPDKSNIDVILGAALPLRKIDTLYYPALVLADMLGGGFASHLMRTIRERDGLTYDINTSLQGIAEDTDGAFRVWATFSPELYEKGVETIRKEMKHFFIHEITADALAQKKEEIIGSYLIGLSTTNGLATVLRGLGEEGHSVSFVNEFPDIIRAVTLDQVKEAATLIPLTKLSVAAAGTFRKA